MRDAERDPSDRALEQLLGSAPPLLEMPETAKQRVLTELRVRAGHAPAAPARTGHRPRRHFGILAAAAVVVLAVLAVLWPSGGSSGIAWADVAQQLMTVRTMGGPLVKTVVAPDGRTTVITGRMSFKDPGLTRVDHEEEVVTEPDGTTTRRTPPNTTLILNALPEDVVVLELFPASREAIHSEIDLTGTLLGPWRQLQLNPACFAWSRLRDLAADRTRIIGRREVAGEAAVGFAAPLAEVMGPQPLGLEPDGEIRVWASAETAIPLGVEVEKRLDSGWSVTDVIEPIEWNVPMPDSLFDDSVLEGYEVRERRAHNRGFPEPELMPDVTLRIGPESGGPVINERDVVGAVMGSVSFESWRRPRYRTLITFELTEEAAERLKTYLQVNPETPLTVDFNGEFQSPWIFRRVHSRFIQVELTRLNKRLIDVERQYLLHGEEAVAAELERRRLMNETPAAED